MTARTCSVEGCDRTHYARGFCPNHHYRWSRYGNPLADAGRRRATRLLTGHELLRLRREHGIPDTGPTDAMRRRWLRQEAHT